MQAVYPGTQVGSPTEVGRLARFATVSALSTALDWSVLLLATQVGAPTWSALTLGVAAGMCNTYFWHSRWTFADSAPPSAAVTRQRFAQFALIGLLGWALSLAIAAPLDATFAAWVGSAWSIWPAKALAAPPVVAWNYTANRFWVFAAPRPLPARAEVRRAERTTFSRRP